MRPLDPRLLPLLRPASRALLGLVAAQVAAGALLVGQAFALATLVVALVESVGGAGGEVTEPAAWFALVTALRALTTWVAGRCAAAAAAQVGSDLRRRLLTTVVDEGSLADRRRRGEVTLLATRGLAALEPYLTRYLPSLVVAVVVPPLTLVAILTQDLASAAIVALTLPLVPVFAILIGQTTQAHAERQWRILAQLSGHFVDVVTGLRTLVTFGRAEAQSRTIRSVTRRYRDATRETLRLGFASSVALELVATLSVALVAVTVGLRLATDGLPLLTAMTVLLLAPEAYWPLRRVGAEFHAAAEGTATLEQVHGLLGAAPDTGGAPVPRGRASTPSSGLLIEDLTLAHPGRTEAAVSGLTAVIPPRGLTAVAGPSGSGKSTLLAALVGDLEPRSGRVLVGADPLEEVRDDWRTRVAWLPQRPWLTPGTVAANVRLGRPDADDGDVREALAQVGLAGPDIGPDTQVGEDGAQLSAGQRARVGLARALVSRRPWVVLDEPTAHLDPETEHVVLQVLRELVSQGRAVVVVAHRQAVLDAADHVVRLPAPSPVPTRRPSAELLGGGTPRRPSAPRTARTPEALPEAGPVRAGSDLVATALGTLSAASGVALTATAGWLIARSAEHPPVLMLMVAIVGVRLFGLARPALRYAERLLSHDVALTALAERRAEVFDALVPLVPGALGRHRGDLLTSVVDDVDAEVDRALRVRQPVLTAIGVGLLTAGLVSTQHLPAAAVVALQAGFALLVFALTRRAVRRTSADRVEHRAELSRRIEQVLGGAGELRLWQAEGAAVSAACATGDLGARASERAARTVARAQAALVAAGGTALVVTAALLPTSGLSGPMAALLVLVPLALTEVLLPLADAGATAAHVEQAEQRLTELLGRRPRVTDRPDVQVARLGVPPDTDLDQLVVGWGAPVCEPVDLRLEPGRRVAVVGPSGCGKSTLVETLARSIDPVRGAVRLDGHDLRTLPLAQVRATVGVLDDDPHVFGSTLRENLRLARPDAADASLEAALRTVSLDLWLDALPDGLDTWLGEGGFQVSGGERARLGLARLVLAGHPVWVLDEPTAHLDVPLARTLATEVLGPAGSGAGRTVVWVTHTTVGLDLVDDVLRLSPAAAPTRDPALV
jgi:ATP-binding cassette, subfamily C, bacterial CydCD